MVPTKNKTPNPFLLHGISLNIEKWNSMFPFDYRWRKKYKVAFGSKEHRSMDFFDIKFDIKEEEYMLYLQSLNKSASVANKQLFKDKVVETSDKMSDEEFDEINLEDDIIIK